MRRRLAALTLITILSPRASAAQDSSLTDQFQVPDSARLVRLNEQLAHRDRVRILTSTGDLIVTGPSANARGLDHRAMTTRRGFSIQDVAPEDRARRLGWDRIQSIEVRGNRAPKERSRFTARQASAGVPVNCSESASSHDAMSIPAPSQTILTIMDSKCCTGSQ